MQLFSISYLLAIFLQFFHTFLLCFSYRCLSYLKLEGLREPSEQAGTSQFAAKMRPRGGLSGGPGLGPPRASGGSECVYIGPLEAAGGPAYVCRAF